MARQHEKAGQTGATSSSTRTATAAAASSPTSRKRANSGGTTQRRDADSPTHKAAANRRAASAGNSGTTGKGTKSPSTGKKASKSNGIESRSSQAKGARAPSSPATGAQAPSSLAEGAKDAPASPVPPSARGKGDKPLIALSPPPGLGINDTPMRFTSTTEDKELVEAALTGDQQAFQVLVSRYRDRCYWTAYKYVQNEEDALDVVQEAFVKAFRQLVSFDTHRRYFTWMYRIVINVSIDAIRRRDVRPAVALEDKGDLMADERAEAPSRHAMLGETREEVWRALRMLSEPYRSVLIMREIDALSCKEIGEMIDVPHATVRWRLHHARQMFKDVWERRILKLPSGDDATDRVSADGSPAASGPDAG